jgi:EpsI family protein
MMNNKAFSFALLILLLTLGFTVLLGQRGKPVILQTNLENLPKELGGYHGSDDRFSDSVYRELNADQHVYRHYLGPAGKIDLYIGYYGTAKGGRTGHNPSACLPGSGWAIVERGQLQVQTSYRPDGVTINYAVATKDGLNNVLLHWYQAAGTKVLANGFQQNIQRFVGRILYNRNDGAYVQVSSLAGEDEISSVKEKLKVFAMDILELLPTYWPVEE